MAKKDETPEVAENAATKIKLVKIRVLMDW